jgi:hypothetical protein
LRIPAIGVVKAAAADMSLSSLVEKVLPEWLRANGYLGPLVEVSRE